jgi:hypothetical protein
MGPGSLRRDCGHLGALACVVVLLGSGCLLPAVDGAQPVQESSNFGGAPASTTPDVPLAGEPGGSPASEPTPPEPNMSAPEAAGAMGDATPPVAGAGSGAPPVDPSAGSAAGIPEPEPFKCPASACQGGDCVVNGNDYMCMCPRGFAGTGTKNCNNIDDCVDNPCGPLNTCIDGIESRSCMCIPGFDGTGTSSCTNIDDCADNPCAPGGSCLDGVDNWTCTCSGGFGNRDSDHSCPFQDNGDGTVLDVSEGGRIEWQRDFTLVDALGDSIDTFCTNLSFAGGGWRFPTMDEIGNTVDSWPDPPLCLLYQPGHCYMNYSEGRGSDDAPTAVRCVR